MPRTSIGASYETPGPRIEPGLVILHGTHVPLALGQGLDDAIWQGHGLRAYSTVTGAWSRDMATRDGTSTPSGGHCRAPQPPRHGM